MKLIISIAEKKPKAPIVAIYVTGDISPTCGEDGNFREPLKR
jgi:hypothetical protein